jgi:putative FmdB family regulatory protein
MPLHRHECESCGHRFRVLVLPGAEDEVPTCPVCGGTSSHRLMPLVAVQFKGTGFYKTDRGRKGGSRSDKNRAESESSNSREMESSGDSKPTDGSKGSETSKTRNESKGSTTSAKTPPTE